MNAKAHYRRRRSWHSIVTTLAAVVVFVTTYALILPAITMEKEPTCGIEEHTHEESCFASRVSLSCGVHSHGDACRNEAGELICGLADFVVHTHDASCYLEDGTLLCTLPEITAHTHDESCVQPQTTVHQHDDSCVTAVKGDLICTEEENTGHTHGTDCWRETEVLTCTIPEGEGHSHGEGCFEEQTTQICPLPESEGHSHTEDCLDEEGTVVCGLEESEGHTHGPECFTTESVLICTIGESEPHIHGDACWTVEASLVCGLEEAAGHSHEAACYAWTEEVTCGMEEGQEIPSEPVQLCTLEEIVLHTHSDGCYGEDGTLACGMLQVEAHVHSEACLTASEEQAVVCGLEEHTHDEVLCYIDNTADVETEEQWKATLPALTGVWAEDLLAVARSQVGYGESEVNLQVDAEGTVRGYTRYGAWYGEPYSDWNSIFVSFCLHYAGIDREAIAYESNAERWGTVLTAREQYAAADAYTPLPGDLVFMDLDDNGFADTVAIVKSLEESILTVYQGDTENRSVEKLEYLLSDTPVETEQKVLLPGDLLGYGILPENPNPDGKNETNDTGAEEKGSVSLERIYYIVALIDDLPTSEEVESALSAYEAAGDWDGYESYFLQVSSQAMGTYVFYEDLSDNNRAQVTNADKLLELEWLWSARTLEITAGVPVYQANSYDQDNSTSGAANVLFHGMSADEYGATKMSFAWWYAIVVEENEQGMLYVDQYIWQTGAEYDKSAYKPRTANGFVLLVYNSMAMPDIQVGDYVSVPFDYTATSAYTGTSLGTITFADAVFKADKDNSGKLSVVGAASTRDFIELNLYDYSTNINDPWRTNTKYPGFQQDYGTTTAGLTTYGMNFGNNITSDYAAGENSVTVKGGTNINATWDTGYGTANVPIEGMMFPTLINGSPALADGTPLEYLFHPNSGYATKKNTLSIDGLFKRNAVTGEYTFNSRENHAQFNPGNDTFTLYDQIISSNFMMYPFGNFLPFNDIVHQSAQTSTIDRAYLQTIAASAQYQVNCGASAEYQTLATELTDFIGLMDAKYGTGWAAADAMNEYFGAAGLPPKFSQSDPLLAQVYSIDFDEPTNFYFGMEMKMNFMQPKDGYTGNDTNGDGASDYPMVFYFTGDDDVWVYIDGVLFLDLSGIHRHVGGEIDFVNGLVHYYALDVSTGDVATVPYKTQTFAEILGSSAGLNDNGTFADYSTHSFNFYYMERGAGSGVCRMNFNFPLLRKNSISVSKAVAANTPIQGDPDYRFQVLKADADGNKQEALFITAGTPYTIYDANDNAIGTGTTDEHGVFTLKAGQRAEFAGIQENAGKYYVRELLEGTVLEQYGNVTVSGESTTTSNNVQVGNDSFTGMDSHVKDMSDGATVFRFTNDVDEEKLSSLSVSKQLTAYSGTTDKYFDIEVTLDGTPLPVGTPYQVGEETRTVVSEGILTIAADETAVISNILAGTRFTVKETSESASGYIVTYSAAEGYTVEHMENGVSGELKVSAAVELVITNAEKGAMVSIPVSKTLSKTDGTERSYTFHLVEVTDQTGTVVKTDGIQDYSLPVKITDGTVTEAFRLTYKLEENQTLPLKHYYRVTENVAAETMTNATTYVVEVTITETDGGNIAANVTGIWKDGAVYTGETLAYTNTLVGSLELSKTVSGMDTDRGFVFSIHLEPGDSGTVLPDVYPAIFYQKDGTEVTTTVSRNADGNIVLSDFKSGVKAVICGIPIGSTWTITEESADGFLTTWTVTVGEDQTSGQGTTATGDKIGIGKTEVAYVNTAMYELPETGGAGTQLYTMGGLMLMISAVVLLLYSHRRRRKEDF